MNCPFSVKRYISDQLLLRITVPGLVKADIVANTKSEVGQSIAAGSYVIVPSGASILTTLTVLDVVHTLPAVSV